jgi:hypothetical protein
MHGYDYDHCRRPYCARPRYGVEYRPPRYVGRAGAGRRSRYDAPFQPLRPDDALARALEREAADLVLDYLREERYGEEYARSMGLRIRGPGDHLRDVARRITRPPYDLGWW